MGYDLSMEQVDKLARLDREGRRCAHATGRGGCFSRATIRQRVLCWKYAEDMAGGKPPARGITWVFCPRHVAPIGSNFLEVKREVF